MFKARNGSEAREIFPLYWKKETSRQEIHSVYGIQDSSAISHGSIPLFRTHRHLDLVIYLAFFWLCRSQKIHVCADWHSMHSPIHLDNSVIELAYTIVAKTNKHVLCGCVEALDA